MSKLQPGSPTRLRYSRTFKVASGNLSRRYHANGRSIVKSQYEVVTDSTYTAAINGSQLSRNPTTIAAMRIILLLLVPVLARPTSLFRKRECYQRVCCYLCRMRCGELHRSWIPTVWGQGEADLLQGRGRSLQVLVMTLGLICARIRYYHNAWILRSAAKCFHMPLWTVETATLRAVS